MGLDAGHTNCKVGTGCEHFSVLLLPGGMQLSMQLEGGGSRAAGKEKEQPLWPSRHPALHSRAGDAAKAPSLLAMSRLMGLI